MWLHFLGSSYCLEANHLIKNLSILWLSYELCPQEITQAIVPPPTVITPIQGQNLVARLANREIIEPRLEVPFSLWGAILEVDELFQELCDRRLGIEVQKSVNLRRWVENIFEAGWQSIEAIFPSVNVATSYRRNNSQGALKRAKYIEISPNQRVVLQLELTEKENNKSNVVIKLTPQSGDRYLPSNINLKLLSSSGEVIYTAVANNQVNFIKKEISFSEGESFTIEISLNGFNKSENFIV